MIYGGYKMKKIAILSIFLVLAVLLAGNALADVKINGIEDHFVDHNSDLVITLEIENMDLVNPVDDAKIVIDSEGDWIDNAVISNDAIDIDAGDSVDVTLTVSVPQYQSSSDYDVTLDVRDANDVSILDAASDDFFEIIVNPATTATINQQTISLKGQVGEANIVSQQEFTITNTGNTILDLRARTVFGEEFNEITVDGTKASFLFEEKVGDAYQILNVIVFNGVEGYFVELNPGQSKTIRVKANTANIDTGYFERQGVLNFDINQPADPTVASTTFNVKFGDKGICQLGPQPVGLIRVNLDSDSDVEDDTDGDYNIGENVKFKFKVENKLGVDNIDFEVEAVLYNMDTEQVVDSDTDSQDIDSGDEELFEFELYLDPDEIEGEDDVVLLLKAYPDESDYKEAQYCSEEKFNINLEQDDADIRVEDLQVVPGSVEAGQSIEFVANILNYGKDDLTNVRLQIKNTELEIDVESERYSIKEYDNDDNEDEQRVRVVVKIPADAEAKDYDFEVYAEAPEDESFPETVTVTVEGDEEVTPVATPRVISTPAEVPAITGSATGTIDAQTGTLVDKSIFDSFKSTSDLPLLFWIILDLVLVFVIVTVILLVAKRK